VLLDPAKLVWLRRFALPRLALRSFASITTRPKSRPYPSGAYLQHPRYASTPQRWPRDFEFHDAGVRRRSAHIYGDGSQTRSFCYVEDLIEVIVRFSRSEEHLPVSIGKPGEFTILECALAVLDVTSSRSELRFEPLPTDDPARREPDITKACAILAWEPRIGLREGCEGQSSSSKMRYARRCWPDGEIDRAHRQQKRKSSEAGGRRSCSFYRSLRALSGSGN
jgi:nucleoside-diphosphate-sugar epimerase